MPPAPAGGGFEVIASRLERTSLLVLVVLALAAWPFGGWPMTGGVVGGGLLSGLSYRSLKGAVGALGPPEPGREQARRTAPARVALGLAGRYALLLVAGYVTIARLRVHPIGVLTGVSAVVVAAMVEAVRARR